mmetsp:Transcript_67450/g.182239  ORF Transcript_67450/g.182239 Transcript_67450/m.182239 type:complete len:281 (+) Transcript_67450:108-950(+)
MQTGGPRALLAPPNGQAKGTVASIGAAHFAPVWQRCVQTFQSPFFEVDFRWVFPGLLRSRLRGHLAGSSCLAPAALATPPTCLAFGEALRGSFLCCLCLLEVILLFLFRKMPDLVLDGLLHFLVVVLLLDCVLHVLAVDDALQVRLLQQLLRAQGVLSAAPQDLQLVVVRQRPWEDRLSNCQNQVAEIHGNEIAQGPDCSGDPPDGDPGEHVATIPRGDFQQGSATPHLLENHSVLAPLTRREAMVQRSPRGHCHRLPLVPIDHRHPIEPVELLHHPELV